MNTEERTALSELLGEAEEGKPKKRLALIVRNTAVLVASLLFLISIFIGHVSGMLKLCAYLCGGAAYIFEYLYLTEYFTVKLPHDELFMIYCFAPLYFLLGLSYMLH